MPDTSKAEANWLDAPIKHVSTVFASTRSVDAFTVVLHSLYSAPPDAKRSFGTDNRSPWLASVLPVDAMTNFGRICGSSSIM